MGLACAHLIMKELGGSVHLFESLPGRTVFRMQMPINHNSQYLEDISYH
jgi:nitrogen-specific signal transduction histidine kinase